MDTDTLRAMIRGQIAALGITPHHAARLAAIPDQTVRDYLDGRDLATGRAFALAAAVGVVVTAAPLRGFAPTPPPARGRKNNPEKSGR